MARVRYLYVINDVFDFLSIYFIYPVYVVKYFWKSFQINLLFGQIYWIFKPLVTLWKYFSIQMFGATGRAFERDWHKWHK